MRQKSGTRESSSERLVKNIRRVTRKQYSSEEKIRIVLDGLRGEFSIAELCRRKGIAESLYYSWSKEFLEAGKHRRAGDTARAATSSEVTDLRREARLTRGILWNQASLHTEFRADDRAESARRLRPVPLNLGLRRREQGHLRDAPETPQSARLLRGAAGPDELRL